MEEKTEITQKKGMHNMICERCNKKKASVFYRENMGGRIKALRLCGECAAILEQAGELEDVSAAVAGFISPYFFPDEGSLFSLPCHVFETGVSRAGATKRCPACGTTMGDMAKLGRVGCAHCYTAFAEELAPTLISAHGKAEHTGRTSAGYRLRAERLERLTTLKKQLKEAVSAERFEVAAELRDQIRSLEAEL